VGFGTGDQANVDRLVRRVRWEFRWCGGYQSWFQYLDSLWCPHGAEIALRERYLESLEDTEGEKLGRDEARDRIRGFSASAQQMAFWLLERDSRLQIRPEEFEREGAFPLLSPLPQWDAAWLEELDDHATHWKVTQAINSGDGFRSWLTRHRAREYFEGQQATAPPPRNVLLRVHTMAPDLASLFPLFRCLFGERVIRLGPETWTRFPAVLSPETALALTGARVVFLEGVENFKRFPQVALKRWASMGEVAWVGADRRRYTLRLPEAYVVTGPPFESSRIEREFRPFVYRVSARDTEPIW
jgi:hypothetical protein